MALFVMLYKVIISFEPADQILPFDYTNEIYLALLCRGAAHHAVQGISIL